MTYVTDQIVSALLDSPALKKEKSLIKPAMVKNQLFIFITAIVDNPSFSSQTKESMTLKPSAFGTTWSVSETMIKKIVKLGIVDRIQRLVRSKEDKDLKKTDGVKRTRLTGIPKLLDAPKAGSKGSKDCWLLLCEGDSAKTFCVTGIPMLKNRDYYGVFPLKGKLLNVRDTTASQRLANAEITNLKAILGLQEGKEYLNADSLRYGHIVITTDADLDGAHIQGLVMNWLESQYPSLLKIPGFLTYFQSPIVKCFKGSEELAFYNVPDYEKWQLTKTGNWTIKYYKGLGTSTSKDVKGYFGDFDNHLKRFRPLDEDDSESLDMVFSKKRAGDRKTWISSYSTRIGNDIVGGGGLSGSGSIREFINEDLIQFSMYDNVRSIPNLMDGLKVGQRKILWTCLSGNIISDVKVAVLAARVSEKMHYHHGEQSLCETITGMGQTFADS